MKRKRSHTIMALAAGVAFFAALPNQAMAQDIAVQVAKADQTAKAGNWAEAYVLYKECTEMYPPERALKLFGPAMGYLWYRRGQSAQKIAKVAARGGGKEAFEQAKGLYEDAIKSFNQCNKIGVDAAENRYKNKVIYMRGQCEMALMQYDTALQTWAQFQSAFNNKNPEEKFVLQGPGRGKYILDKTMCYLKKPVPDLEQGMAGLKWIMQPEVKANYKIPDAAIVGGFQALCQGTKKEAEKAKDDKDRKKSLETELIKFMEENRGMIVLPPYQMYAYTPHFLKLAIGEQKLGMHKAAFMLQSFLPNTTVSREDMELKLKNLGGQKGMIDHFDIIRTDAVEKDLENLNKSEGKGEPHEMTQNLIMAAVYEKEGNSRAAFGIYEMIELYHNDHPKREEWLYHCVRTSYNIGEIFKTTEYGERFLKLFPKSSRRPDVEKYMLTSLFQNGKYIECIEIATKLLPALSEGTKQHDIALYCLGGSHYYLGEPYKASDPLDKHVKLYGKGGKHSESQYSMATQYWDGSNETYLQEWAKAAKKLDKFLNDYPNPNENPYFPLAKYDRANCHTNLEEDELSIEHLDVVISNHKDSPIIDRAHALRGNNYQNLSKFEEAYSDYKIALELSRRAKNEAVEAEVLNYLVLLLGDDSQPSKTADEKATKMANFKKAVQYYDEFWKKYSDGDYKALVAVSGMPALRSVDRGKEGLQNLKQVIMQLAKVREAPGMDKAINSYTEEYLLVNNNNAEQLEEHYVKDFEIARDMIYARSLVKMSLVDAYSRLADEAKKSKDDAGEMKWNLAIKGQLDELATFEIEKLNNFTLVMIANNMRTTAESIGTLKAASRFYEQVLLNAKRSRDPDKSYKNEAIFGQALILEVTEDATKMQKAFADLQAVRDAGPPNEPDRKTKQKAHFSMIRLAYKMGNYSEAIAEATTFLDLYQGARNRSLVRMTLGDANYATGNKEEASRHYQSVLLSATSVLKLSGPALMKVMDIEEEKGNKYKAFAAGDSYVKLCRDSFDKAAEESKMSNKEKDLWSEIKDRVENLKDDPAVREGIEKALAEEEGRDNQQGNK